MSKLTGKWIAIILLLTSCATPLVHDTKTDPHPDTAECINKLWYSSLMGATQQKFDKCMIEEHGWRVKDE